MPSRLLRKTLIWKKYDRRRLFFALGAVLLGLGRKSAAAQTRSFANVAALRANRQRVTSASLEGFDSPGDGGGSALQLSPDQSLRDNGFTVFSDAAGVKYLRTGADTGNGTSIVWAGCKTEGIAGAANTARLQAAINSGVALFIPAGTFVVDLGKLTLPAKTRITGAGRDRAVLKASAPASPNGSTASQSLFRADSVSGIRISNIGFAGSDDSTLAICLQNLCSDIAISDVRTTNCRLGYFYCPGRGAGDDYAKTSGNNMGRNIHVQRCDGVAAAQHCQQAWLGIFYVRDWSVDNCSCKGYYHGIQWWGGDSNPSANGALANERKCFNGSISRVTVTNSTQGGIWGSMGRAITVRDCTADTCGDVCLDCEGGQDVSFLNCKARNGNNGCLATFWFNRNVVFQDCQVEMSGGQNMGFRSYNASLDSRLNPSVSILGGSMTSRSGTGLIDQGMGPIHDFVIRGTVLHDVVISMTAQNIHNVTVDSVKSDFSRPIPKGVTSAAIIVGDIFQDGEAPARGIIRNCQVISHVPQPDVPAALALRGSDPNSSSDYFEASNNLAGGFRIGLSVSDRQGRAIYHLAGNRFQGGGGLDTSAKDAASVLQIAN